MAKRPVLSCQNGGAVPCEAGTGLVRSAYGAAQPIMRSGDALARP